MTEEQIKVAVAEELGWVFVPHPATPELGGYWEQGRQGEAGYRRGDWGLKELGIGLPDYPNSRDACAEFELAMPAREFFDYAHELRTVIMGRYTPNPEWIKSILPSSALAITATARQRCEAFLRMKGKWQD